MLHHHTSATFHLTPVPVNPQNTQSHYHKEEQQKPEPKSLQEQERQQHHLRSGINSVRMRSTLSHLARPRAFPSPTTISLSARPRRRPLTSSSSSTTTTTASPVKVPSSPSHLSSSSSSSSFSSSPWATYSRLLREHPIKTKLLTSSFLMGAGDISCQFLTRYQKQQEHEQSQQANPSSLPPSLPSYDWHRTFKFFFLGGVVVGPALHHWYSFLIRFSPAQTTAGALKRLAMDQLVFAPTFIPVFFSGLQFLDGNFDLKQLRGKLERDYVNTLVANYLLWVPAMLINFRFVPMHYQVLFSNAVGFGWNVFLSAVSHKDGEVGE